MINNFNLKKLLLFVSLSLFTISNSLGKKSIALNFDNAQLNQNQVIAIAQPSARGSYSLIIIEQISNQRPCWQEAGNNPITVVPLLLQFDFTGICERSTDSNGYSIRMGGQDMADQYRLQIIKVGNNLKLFGIPFKDRSLPRLEIGQTNGISNDLSKIILNQGWTFTKRVYEGQTLGHFYLTNDDNSNTLIANVSTDINQNFTSNFNNNSNFNPSNNLTPNIQVTTNTNQDNNWVEYSNDSNINQDNYNSNNQENQDYGNNNQENLNSNTDYSNQRTIPDFSANPNVVPVPQPPPLTLNSNNNTPSPSPLASTLGFNYRVIVYTRNSAEETKVKTIAPDAFRTRIDNQVVLQAGLFLDRQSAENLQQELTEQGLNVRILSVN